MKKTKKPVFGSHRREDASVSDAKRHLEKEELPLFTVLV